MQYTICAQFCANILKSSLNFDLLWKYNDGCVTPTYDLCLQKWRISEEARNTGGSAPARPNLVDLGSRICFLAALRSQLWRSVAHRRNVVQYCRMPHHW